MSDATPVATTDTEPELLDWAAFMARDFPGCPRHDLVAVLAYAAYRRKAGSGSSAVRLLGSKG
jgi:hypothetical protein